MKRSNVLINVFEITPQEVIQRNLERSLQKERAKVQLAVTGLKSVIASAIHASPDWNPEIERVTTSIIIEAENALRELDGRQ